MDGSYLSGAGNVGHGNFGAGEGRIVLGAVHAALVELVHERFLGDGDEAKLGEKRRGEGQHDDLVGLELSDARQCGLDQAAAEVVLLQVFADRQRLDLDGSTLGGVKFGQDGPGNGADDFAVQLGDQEAVNIEHDVADGAGHQLVGVRLDPPEDGRAIAETSFANDRLGCAHGVCVSVVN